MIWIQVLADPQKVESRIEERKQSQTGSATGVVASTYMVSPGD